MKIRWTKKAHKQYLKLPAQAKAQLATAVGQLANWPECKNVKALQGRTDYRLRVGNYRVIFAVDTTARIIQIEEVKKRDERTYH